LWWWWLSGYSLHEAGELATSQTELDSAFGSASERFIIGNKDSDVALLEKIK